MITLTEKTFPQPTLSIYLGGTGIVVGDRLMSVLENLDKKEKSLLETFFIDSQEPAIVDHARSRHYCYQNLNQFRDPTYKDFTDRRFPANLGITPVVNSCEGCGVTRIFGAASLVACRDNFLSLLQQASARLRKNRQESTQPMQIFLTASACGGTGAGMILDAAALVRHFFRERNETPRIFLFLIGPTVFLEDPNISLREDQRARMRASSYALLKELNHFADGKPFVSEYRLRDQTIRIGNTADDDRLFEWVYFIDGRSEQSGTTRTLAEVTWMIAEAQVHLSVTEVGRRVAESMPNQREERLREYPLHFVHENHKGRLTDVGRERLEIASRRTFMASFSVTNVRFPAESIKTWFRWGWVSEALQKTLRRGSNAGRSQVEQYDALLGYRDEQAKPEGLLADLGLTREQLALRVQEDAIQDQALLKALSLGLGQEAAVTASEEFLNLAAWLVEDMKKESSLVDAEAGTMSGPAMTCQQMLKRVLPRWTNFWTDGLARNGRIAERLWQVASAPATGRGLWFLDHFLAHAADALMQLAEAGKQRPELDELEESIAEVRRNVRALAKAGERERGKGLTWRKVLVLLRIEKPQSDELLRRTRGVLTQVNALRKKVLDQRSTRVAELLAPAVWEKAAQQLKQWREHVVTPAITATVNALTLAQNNHRIARDSLTRYQGINGRGRWLAHSTVQIADQELLDILTSSIGDRVSVGDLVLVPLQGEGISRERRRLTLRSLPTFDRKSVIDILFAHIKEATDGVLTFLDNGWMLDDVAQRLATSAAHALDAGAEPLASFSRAAIGQPLQSYLLAPHGVLLPDPFGQELGRMNRLVSRDPLQLGVVSLVFGIPPNSLADIRDLFQQYAVHVGDPKRYEGAQDRYPMHVFSDATESFHEPYSPLSFQVDDAFVPALIDATRELWRDRGGIRFGIREFDLDSMEHRHDWDRIVELAEQILHYLALNSDEAERLFRTGRFIELERIYRDRLHDVRDPAMRPRDVGAHDGNGSGGSKGSSDHGGNGAANTPASDPIPNSPPVQDTPPRDLDA
jgi:hypothetical protein